MDASNSSEAMSYILSGWRKPVYGRHLQHRDFIGVFFGAIDQVKPIIRYLPDLEPISGMLNVTRSTGEPKRITAIDPTFPEGISPKTRIIVSVLVEEASSKNSCTRKEALLTEGGQLLLWSAAYSLNELREGNFPSTVEISTESDFELLDENWLSTAFAQTHWQKDWRELIMKILSILDRRIERGIQKRQEHLESVTKAHSKLSGILSRIEI